MTVWPRALVGGVRCMARPRRPDAEARAVNEAAIIVQAETGVASAKALSREIAARVVTEVMKEIEGDPLDRALAAIDRQLLGSPIMRLATCPDMDVASLFVERRVRDLRSRAGRYLSPQEQAQEREEIVAHMRKVLASRYDRQLRKCVDYLAADLD